MKLLRKHICPASWTLIVLLCIFASPLRAQKQDGYFGDSVLYALSMRMSDSIKTPAVFFAMRERGLKEAIAKKSAHFDYVFRTSLLWHYEVVGEKEKYLVASDSLIQYYKQQNDLLNLYNVWVQQVDRLQMWGDYAEAVVTTRRMAAYAQEQGQPLGVGCANYCFGRGYHNNHQNDEAACYYRLSLRQLTKEKKWNYAISSGINLAEVLINKGNYQEAIALSDSIPPLIHSWEINKGIAINPVDRLRHARLRLRAFCMLNDVTAATRQRDSVLFYNRMYADAAQQNSVQEALAGYEKLVGNYSEAERLLRELAARYEARNNYPSLANSLRTLAEVTHLQGKDAASNETYARYVIANDSANLQISNQQLNQLTKLFRLNELEQEKRIAQAEHRQVRLIAIIVSGGALLVLVICALLFVHSRTLRCKNRELVDRIRKQEEAEAHADKVEAKFESELPEEELSKEKVLFRKIQNLLTDEEYLTQPKLGRDELAALTNTNRTYVVEAIRACTDGWSVSQYIGVVRVKHARYLLDHRPELSLEQVAIACGFQSQSTFTKYYRTHYRITPGEYRKITIEK